MSGEEKALRFSKDAPDEVKAFLLEVAEVSKRHGLSISHEDIAGAFLVEKYDRQNIQWLCFASYKPEGIALDYWRDEVDTAPIDEAQITREAERMVEKTGFDVDICKAMLIIGERNTRRDEEGRLIADPEDIEDAAIDGDEVQCVQ